MDKHPYPTFVKAYGHNGFVKSLKSIVHFYNTRDVLARCRPNDRGESIMCRPAPEEENALASFMQRDQREEVRRVT